MTTHTTAMSCRPLTTSNVSPNMVSVEQYNAVVARLDAEVHTSSRLENELTNTQSQVAFLKSRIVSLENALQTQSNPSTIPQPNTTTNNPSTSGNGNEKEILSHCSDISAHKAAVVAAQQQPQLPRPSEVSKKTPSTISGGVTKKSKSKKERATKAKIPGQSRYWTPEEHKLFLEALTKYGHKDLRNISNFVGTRNMTQVRTHSQKYFMRLMREAKRQNPAASVKPNNETEISQETVQKEVTPAPIETNTKPVEKENEKESNDKYSVPNTCGMTLLCLVGEDTLPK